MFWSAQRLFRRVAVNILVLVGYLICARLGHFLSGASDDASLIWPASGVALASLLLGGPGILPGLFLAALVEAIRSGGTPLTTPILATGVILGPLLASWVLRRWTDFSPRLERIRDVLLLVGWGAALGPTIPATISAATLTFLDPGKAERQGLQILETSWLGDAMGVLLVCPLVLIWWSTPRPRFENRRKWEMVGLLAVTLMVGWLVYFQGWGIIDGNPRPWNFLVFPLVLLACFRFGQHGAVTMNLLVVAMAIGGTLLNLGPFSPPVQQSIPWDQLWLFMAVINVSSMLLAAVLQERRQAQLNMLESHRRLDSILASVPGMVYRCRMDENWTLTYISPGGRDLTGHAPEDLLHNRRLSFNDLIHPQDRQPVQQLVHEQIHATGSYQLAYRIRTARGDLKWIWDQGMGVAESPSGPITHLEGVLLDITDRKTMEESLRQSEERAREMTGRLQLLLREVDHRVKNNLAGLFALLDLYARKAASVKELSEALHGKLLAMKSAHELIADSGWQSVDLARLVRTLARQFVGEQGGERSLHLSGPDIPVAPRQVGSLAMIMQELFTNCLKHGSFRTAGGQVWVDWKILESTASGKGNRIQLVWSESGGPAVSMPAQFGQGLSLIWGFSHYELGGRCQFHFDPPGFRCDFLWNNEP